jgi:bla regulator protein blaR1
VISEFVAHLWQSTLFAGAAWLLTLTLRKNQARVRYWIWFVASLKFLIPFSLLVGLGASVPRQAAVPPVQARWAAIAEQARPLVTIPAVAAKVGIAADGATQGYLVTAAFFLWFCGFMVIALCWAARWKRIDRLRRRAKPLSIRTNNDSAVRMMWAAGLIEPGVFGIFRPVLLLPEGIGERLDEAQLKAILDRELCHVRRRDNLTAAIHMVVQASFWFHPLVWWLGARLIDERERACDEGVLDLGNKPQAYAEGILNVCKLYVESPLACVPGVTGSNLKRRIEAIMRNRISRKLNLGSKVLLATASFVAVAGPVFVGMMEVTPMLRAQGGVAQMQTNAQGSSRLEFEVASIKPSVTPPDGRVTVMMETKGERFRATHEPLINLIAFAYNVRLYQISGAPSWVSSFENGYEIDAKARVGISIDESRLMLQSLLADRTKLKLRSEQKDFAVYELGVGKNGSKLRAAEPPGPGDRSGTFGRVGVLIGMKTSMEELAAVLSMRLDRPVLNRTGIDGHFDFNFEYAPDNQPDSAAPSIFTALQEQIGLQLGPARRPVEILTIERIEKPSEN